MKTRANLLLESEAKEAAVRRGRRRSRSAPVWLLLLLASILPLNLWADELDHDDPNERVMVGEDIFVREDERLREVVCIGCSIQVDGDVSGDVVAIGGSIDIRGSAGETVAIGGSIDIAGNVRRDAVAIGGSIDVSGTVGKEAVAVTGSVRLAEGATVGGDAVSVMGAVSVPPGASVGGEIVTAAGWAPVALSGLLVVLILGLLAGLLLQPLLVLLCFLILGQGRIEVLAETSRRRAGMSFLVGIALLIATFILTVFTAMAPVPAIELPFGLALFVVLVVGYAGISYWVGRGLLPSSGALTAALLGAVLVTIIQLIPLIGQVAFLIFSMMALGSAVLSGFGTSIDWLAERTTTETPVVRGNP